MFSPFPFSHVLPLLVTILIAFDMSRTTPAALHGLRAAALSLIVFVAALWIREGVDAVRGRVKTFLHHDPA